MAPGIATGTRGTPAVLLVGFNRPLLLRRSLDEIVKAGPAALYVALDGPRTGHPEDTERIDECARLVYEARLPTSLLRSERNLGCRGAVPAAISWFFSQVTEGIILEDDCVSSPQFFDFCGAMLERYRHDERVMMVSGYQIAPRRRVRASYSYVRATPIWGWATWRRAWAHHDEGMESWRTGRSRSTIRDQLGPIGFRMASRRFDDVALHGADTWDFQWEHSVLVREAMAVVPSRNLIMNIGFTPDATHTASKSRTRVGRVAGAISPLEFPLVSPMTFGPDRRLERAMLRRRFPVSRLIASELRARRREKLTSRGCGG